MEYKLGVCLDGTPLPSAEDVVARLNAFRALRGYVNPQQGPMAAALYALLEELHVQDKGQNGLVQLKPSIEHHPVLLHRHETLGERLVEELSA
jgi:hypothetical protein